jgi:hypothetical protein
MKILMALFFALQVMTSCQSNKSSTVTINSSSTAHSAIKPVLDQVSDFQSKPEFEPLCLNPSKSDIGIVYLHGMDIATVSDQEKRNREKLFRIAEKLKISVAVPRATGICPTNPTQFCWGWGFSREQLSQIKERVSAAVQICGLKKVVALVGFSNGGYAVNALHSECMADIYGQLISIGAMLNTPAMKLKYNQGCAGQMIRLIGKRDKMNSNTEVLKLLTEKDLEKLILVQEFEGDHEVPEFLLSDQLQKRLNQIN